MLWHFVTCLCCRITHVTYHYACHLWMHYSYISLYVWSICGSRGMSHCVMCWVTHSYVTCVVHSYVTRVMICDMSNAAVQACRTVWWAEWHIQTWVVVMSHLWMSHVTFMNESCHTCEWVMSHINVLLGSWMCYSDHHTVRHACTAAYRSYV